MKRCRAHQRRTGYALLMCLMVVAVTSSIVLTLFQALRLQTAESTARRQIVINQALADGAFEHAVAILLDNPSFVGQTTVRLPAAPTASYRLDVQQDGTNIFISANLQSGATSSQLSRTVPLAALQQRRQNLGLR
jgi:type II secretory pathway component PulK